MRNDELVIIELADDELEVVAGGMIAANASPRPFREPTYHPAKVCVPD